LARGFFAGGFSDDVSSGCLPLGAAFAFFETFAGDAARFLPALLALLGG